MPTLQDAIASRMRQAHVMGARLGARRQITVMPGGIAQLILGWRNDVTPAPIEEGDDPQVDMTDMPVGISVATWDAPADTVDIIDVPSEPDIRAAAANMGCKYVDRGDGPDGYLVYWLR